MLMLASACTSGDGDEADLDALRRKAASVTDLVAKNDWKAVREDFDSTMSASLSEDGLESAWQQVAQQMGAYKSRGGANAGTESG